MIKITKKYNPAFDRLHKTLLELSQKNVKIGIFSDRNARFVYPTKKQNNSNTDLPTNASILAKTEEGKDGQPKRAVLSLTLDRNQKEIQHFINIAIQSKKSADQIYTLIGLKLSTLSKQTISDQGYGKWPALSPLTLYLKGIAFKQGRSITPNQMLIETGQLRQAIDFRVDTN